MRYNKQNNNWADLLRNLLGNECCYCGSKKKLHLHHTIPLNRGGSNTLDNIELVCQICHLELHHQIDKIYGIYTKNNKILNCIQCDRIIERKINIKTLCSFCRRKKKKKRKKDKNDIF